MPSIRSIGSTPVTPRRKRLPITQPSTDDNHYTCRSAERKELTALPLDYRPAQIQTAPGGNAVSDSAR